MRAKKSNNLNILGLIPARGGSKGIPDKNLHPLHGKPLIAYTIETARQSAFLNEVIVSTDSEIIARTALEYKADVPFMRPDQLAMDDSGAKEVIEHAVDHYKIQGVKFDFIVYLQPTSPLRIAQDIDAAIEKMSDSEADSLVTVMDVPHQFGLGSLMIEEDGYVTVAVADKQYRRQNKINYVARNGPAIVVTRPRTLENYNSLYGESVLSYKMPSDRSVDIDEVSDFGYVEWLISKYKKGG